MSLFSFLILSPWDFCSMTPLFHLLCVQWKQLWCLLNGVFISKMSSLLNKQWCVSWKITNYDGPITVRWTNFSDLDLLLVRAARLLASHFQQKMFPKNMFLLKNQNSNLIFKDTHAELPGDPVVKNLPANAGHQGLIPDSTCPGATKSIC